MEDCSDIYYDEDTEAQCDMGHSESKAAKKRDKSLSAGNGNTKPSRGVATSFGFRRRPASTSRAEDNARRRQKPGDKNGNGGSSEDLRAEDILSGRSTPLAKPRKDAAGQQLRSNRQPAIAKTAKVADVSTNAEQAFGSPKDKETSINNNAFGKKSTNQTYSHQLPPVATEVSATGMTTVVGASGVPKTVTKQTVILTYQPQQYSVQDVRIRAGSAVNRSSSVTRYGPLEVARQPGKYTFQTNQLPRPQYPALKNVDTKSAKQVANSTRKVANNSEGWREGAGSAVSSDSGVCTGGEGGCEGGELSPRSRRRPRNLEMVMKNSHSFHLRELQVTDLDIMDEAVVTGHAVIPLPKMPSLFGADESPEYEADPAPTYNPPSPIAAKRNPPPALESSLSSPMSTLERYRTRTRPSRIQTSLIDSKEEEKFVFDRAQPESLMKQNSFIKSSSRISPPTVSSSKESSPSCKSEESHLGNSTTDTWQAHAAGEAMATRSQDDVSIALSVSSCEDEKSKQEVKEYSKHSELEVPKKTIVILDEPPVPHPLLMKSLNLNQHDSFRGSLIGSMTSSNYSTASTCTNQSGDAHNLTLTLEESKFDISALEISTQSLLDDETSPADSLISSTSNSDSNNELHIERETQSVSSSAYQTANTKTKSPEPEIEEDEADGEFLQEEKKIRDADIAEGNKHSPESPGTPTHASGSLSLSDGRDFFDDEIADQPALLFRKNTEGSPSSKTVDSEDSKNLRKSRERIPASPQVQRNRKMGNGKERTPSLDTLSSLASDDLMMMDNDLAQSITSLQSVDDYIERLDSSLRSGLNSLDERQLRQELHSSKNAIRQWSQLLEQNTILDRQLAAMAQGKSAPHSLSASTVSLTNIGDTLVMKMEKAALMLDREAPVKGIVAQVVTMLNGQAQRASLPVRTARLLQRSRAQTPSDAGASDGGATSPAPAPATLLQDVVDIKTLLLQLKRVLQEPGEAHHSMSSETLDPLLAACAESPARGNGRRPPPASPLHPDACAEMRRQIVFLQSQLEERDRLVKVLQQQMLRLSDGEPARGDHCTVATQTDRLRPPMSSALTSSDNSGLVSWNEHTSGRRLQSYSEAQKTKKPVTNGSVPIKCTCGARKQNGTIDKEPEDTVQLKTNSRVGSKYLQAITNHSDNNRRYVKRDSSVGEKTVRKSLLYSTRSRSIENFSNQIYSNKEPLVTKNIVVEESTQMRHHTSYGDLYNGRISSKESVNGNRHSPSFNGQSTDTDYSSDGGYKSLPSSINCNGTSPKKVSGIPRRSIEQKFLSAKHVKASAI